MIGARSPEMPKAFGWLGQIVAFQSTTASKSASSPVDPGIASAAGVSSGAKELFATTRMRRSFGSPRRPARMRAEMFASWYWVEISMICVISGPS